MFQNDLVARDRAEALADKAMKNGASEVEAQKIYDDAFKAEVERLNKWTTENVGLD